MENNAVIAKQTRENSWISPTTEITGEKTTYKYVVWLETDGSVPFFIICSGSIEPKDSTYQCTRNKFRNSCSAHKGANYELACSPRKFFFLFKIQVHTHLSYGLACFVDNFLSSCQRKGRKCRNFTVSIVCKSSVHMMRESQAETEEKKNSSLKVSSFFSCCVNTIIGHCVCLEKICISVCLEEICRYTSNVHNFIMCWYST